jgi:hypothetical protein
VKDHAEIGGMERDFAQQIAGSGEGDQGVKQPNGVTAERDSQPK